MHRLAYSVTGDDIRNGGMKSIYAAVSDTYHCNFEEEG